MLLRRGYDRVSVMRPYPGDKVTLFFYSEAGEDVKINSSSVAKQVNLKKHPYGETGVTSMSFLS